MQRCAGNNETSKAAVFTRVCTDINYVIQKKLKRLHPMQMKFVERIMDEIIPLVQCMYEEGVLADDKTMLDKTES